MEKRASNIKKEIWEYIDLTTRRVIPLMNGEITFPSEEGDPIGEKPYNFKIYKDNREFPLVDSLPISPKIEEKQDTLNEKKLATLLFYMYGICQWEGFWPRYLHRMVPSARTLFPSELYFYIRKPIGKLKEGIYHYNALHHSAVLIREGNYDSIVLESINDGGELPEFVLFVSSLYWKMAEKYKNFTFRLASTESGLVTGNIQSVGKISGWKTKVYFQFVDKLVQKLLNLNPKEEVIQSLVFFYGSSEKEKQASLQDDDINLSIVSQDFKTNIKSGLQSKELIWLHRMMELSQINSPKEIKREFCIEEKLNIDGEFSIKKAINSKDKDIWKALRERNSGPLHFVPNHVPIPNEAFSNLLCMTMESYQHDLDKTSHVPIQLYVVVNRVQGLQPGIYRFISEKSQLKTIMAGNFSLDMQKVYLQDNINCEQAGCVLFFVGDYEKALEHWNGRGYRVMNMLAGIAAQKACIASEINNLYARSSLSFDVALTKELLQLKEEGVHPLYQCIIGVKKGDMGYRKTILV
ncbi:MULTISPECIES: SagB family peptide dehydrogenase [unclassified Bacillus (in: firmicutes)]|uniref:SagB family peptide dehydrogenase n=1 Tax=unclassified Bacillus (in: firmicutes) TaxID=185979 RepID=UPI000BF40A09|nr:MULTISPECIES: SagB family peptide dehydrogenase [unclassified Bacillus (in: firmicutes)]PEU19224.1 hypothetical protein CN525_08095 [Bacillus sp. AFS014408]PFW61623.1 hypothetical protein COL20_16750 [Bacillus sp. AFS075034]